MTSMSSATIRPLPCDVTHLLQTLAGNRMAARKLAQMFLDLYPGKIVLIDAALQAEDPVALRRVVHDLRSSCAMFSATDCLALASRLEASLLERTDSNVADDCARLKSALTDVAEELRRFLADLESSP